MKRLMLAAALLSLGAGAASAQYVERVHDKSGAWVVTRIDVKPGKYNAYLKYWNDVVRPRLDQRKKDGQILGYHVLNNDNPRVGEPDLYVLVKFTTMAAIDQPIAYFEGLDKQFAGSLEGRHEQITKVQDLIEPMGSSLLTEMVFPK